jgi:hypothetical protein
MGHVGVRDPAWDLGGASGGFSSNLRVCIPGGLALGGSVGFCDLAFFPAGSCVGQCGNLGPSRGFESFG